MFTIAQEKQFENKIKSYLKERECYVVKYFANRMTKSGVPDLLCSVNGYFVAVEVKASNGRPSELQKYNIKQIQIDGGVAIILYPEQFELFKELINALIAGNEFDAWQIENRINERWLK